MTSNNKPIAPAVFSEAIEMAAITRLRADYEDHDGTFLIQMIDAFADEARKMQGVAKEAAASGMPAELGKAAHQLKSAAATVGARQVQKLCQQLEEAARTSDHARVAELTAGLSSTIVRARAALARIAAAARAAKA